MNRFIFVVPCYNAEKTIARMLESVFLQTYNNWLILVRDDMSTDCTTETIIETCKKYQICLSVNGESAQDSEPKVILWKNDEKFWEVKNVLEMIRSSFTKSSDIICRLDGDDFLCDLCALQDLNAFYKQGGYDVVWTAHRWSDSWNNISRELPENADPYTHPWVTSHLKTFKRALIDDVNEENFKGKDGEYIKRTGDQAIYLPVLYKSKKRGFMPRVCYYYTIDLDPQTFQTDDAKFQQQEGIFLRQRGFVK